MMMKSVFWSVVLCIDIIFCMYYRKALSVSGLYFLERSTGYLHVIWWSMATSIQPAVKELEGPLECDIIYIFWIY